MTVLVFLVILCPVSFSYASIVFASAVLSGLFLGSPDLFLIFPGIFWAFQVFSSHAGLFRELLHLYLALLRCRDEFLLARFIPSLLFSSTEIISTARIHPQLALFFHRDDFAPVRCVSSLRTSLSGHSVNFRFKQFSTHL